MLGEGVCAADALLVDLAPSCAVTALLVTLTSLDTPQVNVAALLFVGS